MEILKFAILCKMLYNIYRIFYKNFLVTNKKSTQRRKEMLKRLIACLVLVVTFTGLTGCDPEEFGTFRMRVNMDNAMFLYPKNARPGFHKTAVISNKDVSVIFFFTIEEEVYETLLESGITKEFDEMFTLQLGKAKMKLLVRN